MTTSIETESDLPPNRFELELEFVQCLASPAYLHHLATTGVLGDPAFLEFLEYLQYWKKPEYVKYLSYPHCLYFLDLLLTSPIFRREVSNVSFRNFVHEQQFYSWQQRARTLYGEGLPKEKPEETPKQAKEEKREEN
jgi:mediator of RNA polymerase II transcription subunit 31